VPPKVAQSQFAPPSVAAASAQPLAPPTPVNVSTTAASAASTIAHASGTSHSGPPGIVNNYTRVAAREYIAALEKSTQICALNATERDDVLHALHLSYQANIIAEHPTFCPWKSDIHLVNVIASQRRTTVSSKCIVLPQHHICCIDNNLRFTDSSQEQCYQYIHQVSWHLQEGSQCESSSKIS
jgi:hypothetical protein